MPPVVFADCETTGLDPGQHEMYELALDKADDSGEVYDQKDFWIDPLQLQLATPGALQIGKFYERSAAGHEHGSRIVGEEMRWEAAMEIARFTEGCHLVGAKPDFDAGFMAAFLRQNGACPAWHHRLIDVESLAIGLIVGEAETWGRPQSLSNICEALDITRDGHTARGDCEALRAAYYKLMEISERLERFWKDGNGEG